MAIKKYKPTTPGRRGMTTIDYNKVLTATKPERSLIAPKKSQGGRNNTGRITTRHQGGGHKKAYRIIDFKRNRTVFLLKLQQSNTIQIEVHLLLYYIILMVKNVTSSHQKD